MARSERSSSSSSSGKSRRTSKSTGSTISSKSYTVDLPKKSLAMDCILYFAGANPHKIKNLKREEYIEEYDVYKHGRAEERRWIQWHFVGAADEYDYECSGDEESFTAPRSSKRSERSSSNRRRRSSRPKDTWDKRKSRRQEESDSESEMSDSDDGSDYGFQAPPPQHFHGHPPPPPGMPRPPPPRQNDTPAFFDLSGGR